jgi:hypothetical protein
MNDQASATRSALVLLSSLDDRHTLGPGCTDNQKSTGDEGDTFLLTLNASQCFSCEQIGYVIRFLEKDARKQGAQVVVAAASQDSTVVCDYLRRERTHASVMLLGDNQQSARQVALDSRFTLVIGNKTRDSVRYASRERVALNLTSSIKR